MINSGTLPGIERDRGMPGAFPLPRTGGKSPSSFHLSRYAPADDQEAYRQAELFYLQKQIQAQTPMVIVLEDGDRVEGCIEWYDKHTLKVRGRDKTLIYKSAIKYMYKLGENAQ